MHSGGVVLAVLQNMENLTDIDIYPLIAKIHFETVRRNCSLKKTDQQADT